MCGILGANFYAPEKLKKAASLLEHRGVDDEGFYLSSTLSMAHKRLSILDLSIAAHQPMFYHKNTGACSEKFESAQIPNTHCAIVFNGEIYNYREIKTELIEQGYIFTTAGDTELILAAYLAWGTNCVEKFNGMWAFCIYDKLKNILFLSRDRLGIKPLYYFAEKEKFLFTSEIKPLFELGVNFEINADALNHFLIFGFTMPDYSIISNIKKLKAGENLIYDLKLSSIISITKYWHTKFYQKKIKKKEAIQKIYSLLDDAVKMRLLSDVEVGAFLSGGVDSSIIVYFMKKHLKNLKTFSINFDIPEFNESNYAKKIAEQFETDHHEIAFNAKDITNLIDKLPYYYDEPFGDESMIPSYLVSQIASQHVKVVLSGTGSDEIFGGYKRYQKFIILRLIVKLPNFLKTIIAKAYKIIHEQDSKKLQILFNSKDDSELYCKLLSYLSRGNNANDYVLSKYPSIKSYFQTNNRLNNLLNFDQNYYLTEDLLVKEDRATMAHTIEGRVPFLDYRLVELANSLPNNFKINKTEHKFILKESFKHILPKEILYRKKQGFGVPLAHYFRNELKEFAYECIFTFNDFEYYDKKHVLALWKLHQSKKADYSSYFWKIIIFNKWYKLWSFNTQKQSTT